MKKTSGTSPAEDATAIKSFPTAGQTLPLPFPGGGVKWMSVGVRR